MHQDLNAHPSVNAKAVTIRPLQAGDNAGIAQVIRQVSIEYGLSAEAGYSVADPELDQLYQVYQADRAAYWVIEHAGQIVGGGGVSPLSGASDEVCELQKMYLLKDYRGLGLGRRLIEAALAHARQSGFRACYLETTELLGDAIQAYQKHGFDFCERMGHTGHGACQVTMLKRL